MITLQTSYSQSVEFQFTSANTRDTAKVKNPTAPMDTGSLMQFIAAARDNTLQDSTVQNALFHFNALSTDLKADLTYNGTPIAELSPEKAKKLVSPSGYFGIEKTAARIADFVLKGAGNDVERLKSGRQGILQGLKEAEKAWGDTLPDISYQTIEKALSQVDEKLADLGAGILDTTA